MALRPIKGSEIMTGSAIATTKLPLRAFRPEAFGARETARRIAFKEAASRTGVPLNCCG